MGRNRPRSGCSGHLGELGKSVLERCKDAGPASSKPDHSAVAELMGVEQGRQSQRSVGCPKAPQLVVDGIDWEAVASEVGPPLFIGPVPDRAERGGAVLSGDDAAVPCPHAGPAGAAGAARLMSAES